MTAVLKRPTLGAIAYFAVCFLLGAYFTFAAVQGDYGLFQRVRIEAETKVLRQELAAYTDSVTRMENKTRRLSDSYLDLDLLDQQVREVLGMVRTDEIVIQ
ncbi:septum formation initiator family protein [Pseudohalocynthiibacter aestuariivivens]|jgi:cell division protein FtsB|uniref:Septum formation initiator family protein n=1 Tax=Pseudohalocynthiibacter aestuariivivens TaxID=1591409 RepID=A0ABV5JIR4_9RHOB|nr:MULTISPECIES: septum formation initiator family protein [Pseudohalocynthiibacter]MBS9716574.1 septum formation initiator family protein [Pseudohalocynthiibacter aestuariivivens]MCK0101644.1 septum formation initiator family protein [Pseudohalocynthiibacter sp. F2068]